MIFSIYKDFFKFLKTIENLSEKEKDVLWENFNRLYLRPNSEILFAIWKNFEGFDLDTIKARVEMIRYSHYSHLISELADSSLEKCIIEFMGKLKFEVKLEQVDIYLLIGFWGADGFCIRVNDKFIIGFSLERFSHFTDFDIIFYHELGHYLVNHLIPGIYEDSSHAAPVLREGFSFNFSYFYSKKTIHKILFMNTADYNWCLSRSDEVNAIIKGEKFESAGKFERILQNFIAYKTVKYLVEGEVELLLENSKYSPEIKKLYRTLTQVSH